MTHILKQIIKGRVFIYGTLVFFCISGYLITREPSSPHLPPNTASIHCLGANATFYCSMNHFELITRAFGPKVAMQNLKHEYASRAEIVSDCHQLSHVIGNSAVELYGGDIAQAFNDGDSFCWSGYYHGVVERAVKDTGEASFLKNTNQLCAEIPGKERYSFDYYNCVHGIGHGIMAIEDNELFASLPLCDKLDGEWERKSCYGGVFMENIMVDNRSHFAKYLKKDDLMYPCNSVEKVYKEQCYLMQTSYALSQNGYNFRDTFALCANVEPEFRDTCTQSIGRDASGSTVSNTTRTVTNCSYALDDNQYKNCITGAVKDFISYFHGDNEAQGLCRALPSRFISHCDDVRVSYLRTL